MHMIVCQWSRNTLITKKLYGTCFFQSAIFNYLVVCVVRNHRIIVLKSIDLQVDCPP